MSDFEKVAALSDIPEGTAYTATVGRQDVVLVREGEEVFAVEDMCSHALYPLSEGEVSDCHLECALHGSRFDLRSGKPDALPATEPVATFAVRIDNGDVYVDVTSSLNGVTPQ
jgi:3-phenylpropionate/trans-cinnamate dioxygenase ferredoxin subunit